PAHTLDQADHHVTHAGQLETAIAPEIGSRAGRNISHVISSPDAGTGGDARLLAQAGHHACLRQRASSTARYLDHLFQDGGPGLPASNLAAVPDCDRDVP